MKIIESIADLGSSYDVLVLGAGPAGLAAAEQLARLDISVLVVDENFSVGGQIFRGIQHSGNQLQRILGRAYSDGRSLIQRFSESRVDYAPCATAWYIDETNQVSVSIADETQIVAAADLIIAAGAQERPFPIEGWTQPGVMTVGAAQTLLKASGLVPDQPTILVGCGPLVWLYAAQMLRAGKKPIAILDTSEYRAALRDPLSFFRFATSHWAMKGLALIAQTLWSVRVHAAKGPICIERSDTGLTVRDERRALSAGLVLLHHGLVPNMHIPAALGCTQEWNSQQLCFQPKVDEFGRTSVPRVFIAGDGAGIGGAEIAEERGRLAALAVAKDRGVIAEGTLKQKAAPSLRRVARLFRSRVALDRMFLPRPTDRKAIGAALACRCEEVTGEQLRRICTYLDPAGPNQAKFFSRCGMGPCQGRFCNLTLSEAVAEAQKTEPVEIGITRARFPTKPITLREVAGIPNSEAETNAVVRTYRK